MTTPAINRDTVDFRPGYSHFVNWNTTVGDFPVVDVLFRNVNCSWEGEHRPVSGTVPKTGRFAWRDCRGWHHDGYRWVYPSNRANRDINYGTYGTRYEYTEGSFWGISPPAVPTFPTGLINQAEIKALNRLKDQDFNLGVFVAEFHKTAHMVATAASRIRKEVARWRRFNSNADWLRVVAWERWLARKDWWKRNIPASWLEMQYGWTPLLSDVFGLIQELSEDEREPLIHCKGYAKTESELTYPVSATVGSSSAIMRHKLKQECWVSLYYSVANEQLANASELGLINPAEIVWECIPYSFVVDWFIPIGSWLSSLTAEAGYTLKGGSQSQKTTIYDGHGEVSWEGRWNPFATVKAYGQVPTLKGGSESFLRKCYTESPVPGVYFKNPLSAKHAVNAIALLAQAFR